MELAAITSQAATGSLDASSQSTPPVSVLTVKHASLLERIVSLVPRDVFQSAVVQAGGHAAELERETASIISALKAGARDGAGGEDAASESEPLRC